MTRDEPYFGEGEDLPDANDADGAGRQDFSGGLGYALFWSMIIWACLGAAALAYFH